MSKLLVVVDMQYDFVMPDGALYVPGAEKLLVPMIQHIFSFDRQDVVFTMDTHYDGEGDPGFGPHCLFGTKGWQPVIPQYDNPPYLKSTFDVWESQGCALHLAYRASRYDEVEIVGVAADYCVRYAYEGFKQRGYNVRVNPRLTVGIKENPYE